MWYNWYGWAERVDVRPIPTTRTRGRTHRTIILVTIQPTHSTSCIMWCGWADCIYCIDDVDDAYCTDGTGGPEWRGGVKFNEDPGGMGRNDYGGRTNFHRDVDFAGRASFEGTEGSH